MVLLSHELRTPLQAMLGWVQVMRARAREEEAVRQGLDAIERNIRAQAQVIDDLLEMAEILSGSPPLQPRRVLVSTLLDAALTEVSSRAAMNGVALNRNVPAGEKEILVDAVRIQRVIQILLSRALEFTAPGGTIRVDLRQEGPHLEVVVTDRSPGKDRGLGSVIDPFRDGAPSSTTDFGSLGIGLGNAQKLVEIQGGAVRAESAGNGRGASFTISLPRSS